MGYTTEFKGSLQFSKPLTADQVKYIQAFNNTRRMKRDMKEILSEFNELLKRNGTVCIADIAERTEWTISPKETVEEFIKAIEAAVDDETGGSCELRSAEVYDNGYKVEIGVRYRAGDDDGGMPVYLIHANQF